MKLSNIDIKDIKKWEDKGYSVPKYSRDQMCAETEANPSWIHFGAGNLFRGYIAALQDTLLNEGLTDTGIIACESYDKEMIDRVFTPYDSLCLQVVLQADGNINKNVIGSVAQSVVADSGDQAAWTRLKKYFCSPSLQLVSFTITVCMIKTERYTPKFRRIWKTALKPQSV